MPGKGNKSLSFAALAALYLLLCVGSLWGCSLQQEEQVLEEAKIQEADAGEEDSPDPEESAAGENEGEDSAPGGQSGRVVVHVCGQVAAPGVYELAEGSRLVWKTASRSMCLRSRNFRITASRRPEIPALQETEE